MVLNISFRIFQSIEEDIGDECSRASPTTRRFGHIDSGVQVEEMEKASKTTLEYQPSTTSLPSIQTDATYAICNSTHGDREIGERGEFLEFYTRSTTYALLSRRIPRAWEVAAHLRNTMVTTCICPKWHTYSEST